jgi:hypothetical protein
MAMMAIAATAPPPISKFWGVASFLILSLAIIIDIYFY